MTTNEFRRAYRILGEWPKKASETDLILNDTALGSMFWVESQVWNDAFNSTGTDVVKQRTSVSDEEFESILNGG